MCYNNDLDMLLIISLMIIMLSSSFWFEGDGMSTARFSSDCLSLPCFPTYLFKRFYMFGACLLLAACRNMFVYCDVICGNRNVDFNLHSC